MLINFWDCQYSSADEMFDDADDDYFWVYECSHPLNKGGCLLEQSCMYGDTKCDCPLLDVEEKSK